MSPWKIHNGDCIQYLNDTTGVAAVRNGRSYIGIELSKEFADMSEQRLRNLK